MTASKILFLATEDWFVGSHFLPLLRQAKADGYEVVVAARVSGALASEPDIRVVAMPFARRSLAPGDVWGEVQALNALLNAEKPDLVHAIALKPIALSLLADRARSTALVMALTGRGYLEARGGWRQLVLDALAGRMRAAIQRGHALLLTENQADREWVRGDGDLAPARMMIMPGAGVDPAMFHPAAEPTSPPIIVGLAARLVRSKGIDIAVEAIARLRAQGMAIELRVAGAVDPDNPEHVADNVLATWRSTPGIQLCGRITDINAFWAAAHVACLPSRGGEGLPRSLLEAAACGRPIVTTAAPGCADFVVAGETGFVVPLDRGDGIATAIATLASDPVLRRRMGAAARKQVLTGYTEAHAAAMASEAWRRCLAARS